MNCIVSYTWLVVLLSSPVRWRICASSLSGLGLASARPPLRFPSNRERWPCGVLVSWLSSRREAMSYFLGVSRLGVTTSSPPSAPARVIVLQHGLHVLHVLGQLAVQGVGGQVEVESFSTLPAAPRPPWSWTPMLAFSSRAIFL